jgi:hypothetical protein
MGQSQQTQLYCGRMGYVYWFTGLTTCFDPFNWKSYFDIETRIPLYVYAFYTADRSSGPLRDLKSRGGGPLRPVIPMAKNYWANNSHKLDLEVAALLRPLRVFTESGPRPWTLKAIFEGMTIKLSTEMEVSLKMGGQAGYSSSEGGNYFVEEYWTPSCGCLYSMLF